MNRRKKFVLTFLTTLVVLALSFGLIYAGGFLIVTNTGVPYKWDPAQPVPYNPDQGMLGLLTNAQAVQLVDDNVKLWDNQHIPTSSLSFTNAGSLPIDVQSAADFAQFNAKNDSINPVIFDVDGSLLDALGFDPGVLGFASVEFIRTLAPFYILEGKAVLNGNWIDGDSTDGVETTVEVMGSTLAHEIGHFLNLDHTQVNGQFFIGDDDDPGFVTYGDPTPQSTNLMFPFFLGLPGEPTAPNTDDIQTISALYPTGGFPTAFGTIEGSVFESDGTTPFAGADVIARNVADPFGDAVSRVSGALFNPGGQFPTGGSPDPALEGQYELPGLMPGASYTVEIVQVNPRFTGGSSVGMLDPPAILPSFEEFWNGASEGATIADNPLDAQNVVPSNTASGIDFIINRARKFQLSKFDGSAEFVASIQSLTTSFDTPNGANDYAAVRYSIPASITPPFTVTMGSFFNNDDQTTWPRVLLTAANSSGQPDLQNPLAEVNGVTGPELGQSQVMFDVTRDNMDDVFMVVQFPQGQMISDVGSGGGPALGGDGSFSFGFIPGNLFSTDGVTFVETINTLGSGSVGALNWDFGIEIVTENFGPDPLEPNGTKGTATPISFGERKKGSIDPPGDLDFFTFTGSAGDVIQADISAATLGSMLDGILTLVDINGDTLARQDDEFGFPAVDPKLQAVLPADGTYFIIMDSFDNAEDNNPVGGPDFFYELELNTFTPPFEPNDATAQATPLASQQAIDAALDVAGDIDFFSFTAGEGEFLTAQLELQGQAPLDDALGSALDPVLTLFDTDGSTVLATRNATSLQFALPAAGTYFIAVADLDGNGGPDFFYRISLDLQQSALLPPTDLRAIGGKDKVELSWQAPQLGTTTATIDAVAVVDEVEPNNTPDQAQVLEGTTPLDVNGNAEVSDVGGVTITFQDNSQDDIEDLYKVTLQTPGINLKLTGLQADLDLYIIDLGVTQILGQSGSSGTTDEEINDPTLAAGTYLVGVTIFDPSPGQNTSPYTLTVTGDLPGAGPALQSFNIYRSQTPGAQQNGSLIQNVDASTTTFTDSPLPPGTFFYQVTAVYDQGESPASNEESTLVTSVADNEDTLPTEYALEQNFPNPFNPTTEINYAIPVQHGNQVVRIDVYNMLGQKVRTLVNKVQAAGNHSVTWDGRNDAGKTVTSGLYLYKIKAGSFVEVKKMLLLK